MARKPKKHKPNPTKLPQKYLEKQRRRISDCLQSTPVNIEALREIAFHEAGFLSTEFRQKVWPKLLNVDIYRAKEAEHFVKPHTSDDQIQRDIDRSLWHFDCLKNIRAAERRKKRKHLFSIINAVLNENKDQDLHYYQGYHDLCSVFLIVQGQKTAYALSERASLSFFRESMGPSFDSVMNVLQLLFPLIKCEDEALYSFLRASTVEPYVAISWMITWFSHHISEFEKVSRLFDAFLCSHPLFALYVSATLILKNRDQVLAADCEFGSTHSALASLPKCMDVEDVLENSRLLFLKITPLELQNRARVKLAKRSFMMMYPYSFQTDLQLPDRLLYDHYKVNGLDVDPPMLEQTSPSVLSSDFRVEIGRAISLIMALAVALIAWYIQTAWSIPLNLPQSRDTSDMKDTLYSWLSIHTGNLNGNSFD